MSKTSYTKPSKIDRIRETLLNNAIGFCRADKEVQLARRQWSEIHSLHDPYAGVCCLPWGDPSDENDPGREALPKKEWCEHCKRIMLEAIDYDSALWKRRAAKTGMKRAYKRLIDLTKKTI
jgi:hypothetical protein